VTLLYAALGDSMSIDIYAGGPGRGATSLLPTNRDGRDRNAWGAHEIRCTWWRAIKQAGWLS
jgi:hypothetical protein